MIGFVHVKGKPGSTGTTYAGTSWARFFIGYSIRPSSGLSGWCASSSRAAKQRGRLRAQGVGVNFGVIQARGADLEQLHLAGHVRDLHKQSCEFIDEVPANGREGVVIRVAPRCNETKGHGVVGGVLQLASGEHAGCVAVDQDS